MDNKEAKIQLIRDYGKICFLGGIITETNSLTVHHIKPVRLEGKTILINLALLTRLRHDMFNLVESNNPYKAKIMNDGFVDFKETRDYKIIEQLKEYVEKEIDNLGYIAEERYKKLILRKR